METGYVNARVRGMYSRLLDHKTISDLILKPDITSLITELEKTPYREDIERAALTLTGVNAIEQALRMNMTRSFQKVLSLVEGEAGEKYIQIFTRRWDVQNLKTILRGKKIHASHQEIRDCLIPAGELDEAYFTEMIRQPDLKSVIDLLTTWDHPLSYPLVRAFEEYTQVNDLVILEYALDKFSYQQVLEGIRNKREEDRIVRNLISIEIDVVNIKNILMLVQDRIEPEDGVKVLLEGGKELPLKKLNQLLLATSLTEVIDLLENTSYRFLQDLNNPPGKEVKVSACQALMDRYLTKMAVRMFRGDPLSITIIIGYLWAKHTEVVNLRVIARCKEALVPPEEVEAELIYV